jgi:glycosyltransferase involved in cell wall biosynthesis
MDQDKTVLVSVIVPTKNSSETLEECLLSIKNQTYKNIELIVVDNFSTDNTPEIAKKYADKFLQIGPERSAQRNFGVKNSIGYLVAIIDSDMKLSEKVIEDSVFIYKQNIEMGGIIIPEESFGEGFWAQCKKLERSYYVGVSWMEAARVFKKDVYEKLGGYNSNLVSGEDFDLSHRAESSGKIERISSFIYHNEGKFSLLNSMKKKFYYASKFQTYMEQTNSKHWMNKDHSNVFKRYALFFKNPIQILKNPILWLSMIFMKTCELGMAPLGLIYSKIKK